MKIWMDEGFSFGLSVFETIGIENGQPLFLGEHLERMEESAKFFGIPFELSVEQVLEWLAGQRGEETADFRRHGALKIMLSQKNTLFLPRKNPYTARTYEKGFAAEYSAVRRNETSPFVYRKTANYGECILENRACHQAGLDERIFLNTRGELTEGTVSNLFFVRDGEVITPALSCGLLPGIIRRRLLEKAYARETVIRPRDVEDCQECFVTNSLMGIMPVRRLGAFSFPGGPKTAELAVKAQLL